MLVQQLPTFNSFVRGQRMGVIISVAFQQGATFPAEGTAGAALDDLEGRRRLGNTQQGWIRGGGTGEGSSGYPALSPGLTGTNEYPCASVDLTRHQCSFVGIVISAHQ